MRADRAVDQQLQQVRAQHVPVVIVVLLAFVAAHHQTANSLVRQQCLVDRQIGEIGFDGDALLRVQRLARLERVERRRRIARVIGERVGRQTWRQVVTHGSTVRSPAGIAPALARPSHRRVATLRAPDVAIELQLDADKMGHLDSAPVPVTGGPTHVDR